MNITRRNILAGLSSAAALSVAPRLNAELLSSTLPASSGPLTLPRKSDFAIPDGITYINAAYTHPMSIAGREAMRQWGEWRASPGVVAVHGELGDIKAEFAALINADKSEISYIPNTSTGENLIVNGMDLSYKEDNVVTDALHFEGAILHLQALQKRYGLDVRIVEPYEWRIRMEDLERVVDKKTKLIEISLVAMDNGFEYDLKAVCDLAHAHGAYVYADIVQAAGSSPIDVRASGVDFCACSSFKWLMGDFGLGFLYVKKSLLGTVIKRSQYGYYEATSLDPHFLPGDTPNPSPYTWELNPDATGYFEVGTNAIGATRVLGESLPYIRRVGVENIRAYRQPMLKRLREEMPRLGFACITPPETTSGIISFAIKDPKAVLERLKRGKVNVRVAQEFIRISPSVYNDMADIDRLLAALA